MGNDKKNTKKVPSAAVPTEPSRVPRRLQGVAVPGEMDEQHPVWRIALLDRDHDGSWSWKITDQTLIKIVDFMATMERLTWREIRQMQTGGDRRRGPKHKSIPRNHLCKEAQERLVELNLDDFDELFRFRTGNMERLWGVLIGDNPRIFYPIWWDPEHKVCPSADR
ncbi:hypothetical protein OHT57_12550 [Streptomyces sp. NBC_00285]|uniref:hypothetical protein n=1 Tax=Streptomyces sp. NBC_00285 TaxID=2975700 RepID=UPI002E2AEE3E|nr:hypothetical protein [Streptomyces sp. NBC_00285]